MYFLSQNERLVPKPSIHYKKIELNNGSKSEKTQMLRKLEIFSASVGWRGYGPAGTQNILIGPQMMKLLNLGTKRCGMKIYITMDNIIEFCKAV